MSYRVGEEWGGWVEVGVVAEVGWRGEGLCPDRIRGG